MWFADSLKLDKSGTEHNTQFTSVRQARGSLEQQTWIVKIRSETWEVKHGLTLDWSQANQGLRTTDTDCYNQSRNMGSASENM